MSALAPGAPPAPPTTLFGRDEPRARLTAALVPGMVTALVGPPGVGKSTLAAAVAHLRVPAVWADLSAATTGADLWGALGAALSVPLDTIDQAHARLAGVLARRATTLVVLDATEHLDADAWAEVERLARAVPGAAWLVTSVVRPVGSARVLELAPLAEADAVALLLARARDRALDAPPDPADPAWSALAERLSGLPLALELAAGRFGVLTAAQILERVDRPRLLAGGRHGSVDGALRYAWDLLGEADRAALVTCAAFRGGFDLAAAEALLGDNALERLTALRERSALAWRDGRFHVLDGLRRLAEAEGGERIVEARARHAAYYAGLAERQCDEVQHGRAAEDAVGTLGRERRNLEAAWAWAREVAPTLAVRVARGVVTSVAHTGPMWGAEPLGDVGAFARAVGGAEGARLLYEWGYLCRLRGHLEDARAAYVDGYALAERAGDRRAGYLALVATGPVLWHLGDLAGAREYNARAQAAASDAWERGYAWSSIGFVEGRAGDLERSAEACEAAVVELEADGAAAPLAILRSNLAVVRLYQRRHTEARVLLEASVRELSGIQRGSTFITWLDLAAVHLLQGRLPAALAALREAEQIERGLERPSFEAKLAAYKAAASWAAGDLEAARQGFARVLANPEALASDRATSRALLAVLDPGPGSRAELDAVRAGGLAPQLLGVLDAAVAGEPLPAPTAMESTWPQLVRLLLGGGATSAWKVDTDGRWFERPTGRVDLSRRGALRRILAALATARRERPGVGLSVDEVFAAGWPGEHALPEAAAGRVYTAIRELRALGLENVLQRQAEGYLLDPAVRLALV